MKRKTSLFLALIAFIALPVWGYVQASHTADAMRQEHGWVCGMPIMAIYMITLLGSSVFSLGSLAFGLSAYRELPIPRPLYRVVELLTVSLPLLAMMAAVLLLLAFGA